MGSNIHFKLVILFMLTSCAWADVLPGPALPEQVSKSITAQQPRPEAYKLPGVPSLKEPETPGGEEAKKIKFQLNNIIIINNHVYSDAELRKLYQDKLHKVISVAELFQIVQTITNYYRNNGYIISRAILPPQHVKDGIVRVEVIEGYIGDVQVAGTPRGATNQILAYGHKIQDCPPLEIKRMERYLLLANEIPATEVRAVLAPSKTKTGAADLYLVGKNNPITGYMSYDNYGTRYIGPQQITANLGLNSIVFSSDSTQFTFTKTPKGKELNYRDINYGLDLDAEGRRWLIGETYTRTHPLFVLAPVHIDGINVNYYTGLQFRVIRSRNENLTTQLTFNYLDTWVNAFDTRLYADHIRSIGLNAAYNVIDNWRGSNSVYVEFRQGLPIMGYTSDTSITAQTSRPGGHADYTKFVAQLTRLQGIKGPLSLYLLAKGQYAFVPVLAYEQFTFGGPVIGRGYDIAEIIGDKGASGTVELRYDLFLGKMIQAIQFYAFYDYGVIWNYEPLVVGTAKKVSASSTGAGLRFYFTKHLSGNFMWTQVLTKKVAAESLIGDGWRPRMFFSIVLSIV